MRRQHAFLLFACLAVGLAAQPGRTQDPGLPPYYWPHQAVGIPINAEKPAQGKNQPTDFQLYYWVNGGAMQKGPKLPVNKLQELSNGKQGILFTADRDGDYEFTVQYVYADNTVSPQTDQLRPQQRVVIDTTPPRVEIAAGATGVSWRVTDDNMDPREIKLECRYPGQAKWTGVTERTFQARDQFSWPSIPAGKVLEVRVQARDRAGHEGVSQIVRVPQDAASGVGFPKAGGFGTTSPGAASLPPARIDFVNTLAFDVDYTIQKMGRSGVRAAHLFVQRNQGNWEFVKKFDVKLMPADKDHNIALPYAAKEEGIYGFYIIPESGAGHRAPDPKRDDPPMINVVVDKTAPYIRVTSVQVRSGGSRGPLVEITWQADDPNLMPDPVSLEWSLDAKAAKWNEIKYRLKNDPGKNTGRYTWEVPDENLWKFYVRARAVDKAANTGETIWSQKDADNIDKPTEVIVDLDTPSGVINRVRNGNTPNTTPKSGGSGSDRPITPVPLPVPAPPAGSGGIPVPILPENP